VIGIPLPFFSYGGSSLWGFTILLFILLKLDAHRMQVLNRIYLEPVEKMHINLKSLE
jgi:rod shape determining protein RodA